jgi:drug/metabolite transporter (DMT)-like permease
MTPLVIGLVLGSAVTHAAWNAMLRSGADRLWSIVVMTTTSAALAIPFIIILPPPALASWPYLAPSAVLQILYCLLLARAYREGDLAQVYPIARGISPLLVTLGAAAFAGEHLSPVSLAGVALISTGVVALTLGGSRPSRQSTLFALGAGVFISAYTVADGLGARLSGHAESYTVWLFLLQGAPMPWIYLALRGPLSVSLSDPETRKAVAGGALSMLAYGVILWALTLAPMGQVSALRETAILFAAIIGVVFLREVWSWRRLSAATIIATGAVMLSASH